MKTKKVYVCNNCGYESIKWLGKCPDCMSWNSFNEELKSDKLVSNIVRESQFNMAVPKTLKDINSSFSKRMDTNIKELNRVLGGGLIKGSLTVISGDPGIGKSTLLLQVSDKISKNYGKVLYVSGEESEEQIKMRAERLNVDAKELYIVSETNLVNIRSYFDSIDPVFVIIDSIQTIYDENLSSAPGSVSQVRECANSLMRYCKGKDISLFLVAHVTKQGELAGPRILEHMVDTVLSFEGDRSEDFRILKAVKNRFGTTSEIGVFEMVEAGLSEVSDPSKLFLEDTNFNVEGSAIIGVMEGTRPILIELQALVTETKLPMPRRTAVGIDFGRLNLILAVLEKKEKIYFYNYDVYVNIVGGLNIDGTTHDLGLALSLISSIKGSEFKLKSPMFIGEIGLTGEVRSVSSCEKIIKEGLKMGIKNIVLPYKNLKSLKLKYDDLNIIGVTSLKEAIKKVF